MASKEMQLVIIKLNGIENSIDVLGANLGSRITSLEKSVDRLSLNFSRLDDERLFSLRRFERVEDDIDNLKKKAWMR